MNMIAHTMLRDPPPATRDSYHALEREYGARNYKPFDVVLTLASASGSGTLTAAATSIVCRPTRPSIKGIATRASWRR